MSWADCTTHDEEARSPGFAVPRATLRVRRLEKSITFYKHVFGFRVVADARHERDPCVIMAAPGQACLTLREEKRLMNVTSVDVARRNMQPLRFSVGDLDEARAALWDQGVPLAPGTGEPGEAGMAKRSLFVDDPDGHRIELLETETRSEPGTS